MKESLKTFSFSEIPNETIISTKEEIIEEIYEGKNDETIQEMRIRYFMEKVTKGNSFVKPERLPPTKEAFKYQIFTTYFQTQECFFSPYGFFLLEKDIQDHGLAWKFSQDHDNPEIYNTKIQ